MKPRITIVRQMPLNEQIQIECEIDPKDALTSWMNNVEPLLENLDARHLHMSTRVAKTIAYSRGLDLSQQDFARQLCALIAGVDIDSAFGRGSIPDVTGDPRESASAEEVDNG